MIPFPYLSAHQTGSRYTVMPAVLDTDEDWLVLVEDLKATAKEMDDDFVLNPWSPCLPQEYNSEAETSWRFRAWRRGEVNLIVTDDRTMYLRSVAATLLAAKLNLKTKEERVELFRAIKFGDKHEGRLP